jgi:hypothetical protein
MPEECALRLVRDDAFLYTCRQNVRTRRMLETSDAL